MIGIPCITLGFGERPVAEHGHDLICAASCLGETSAGGLTQPVRLAFEWESSGCDRGAHPLAEPIDRGWAVEGVHVESRY